MTQVTIHIPDDKMSEFSKIMSECDRHGIKRGVYIADAVKEMFVSGKWAKFFNEVSP